MKIERNMTLENQLLSITVFTVAEHIRKTSVLLVLFDYFDCFSGAILMEPQNLVEEALKLE